MKNDVDLLMEHLRSSEPGAPRLTWYGRDGERIELSGRVLDNWAAKSAGFLTEEFDAGPGSRVGLDLPPHWKTLCIALGALAAGARLEEWHPVPACGSGSAPPTAEVLFTNNPRTLAGQTIEHRPLKYQPLEHGGNDTEAQAMVAVALPALALSWDSPLSPGQHDYATEVRMFADTFNRLKDPGPGTEALPGLSYAHLRRWAEGADLGPVAPKTTERKPGTPRPAVSVTDLSKAVLRNSATYQRNQDNAAQDGPLLVLLRYALAAWWRDGSIVLFEERTAMDPATLGAEQATPLH